MRRWVACFVVLMWGATLGSAQRGRASSPGARGGASPLRTVSGAAPMPARFAPAGRGFGRQEGRFAGGFRTPERFGRHVRPFRRHFRVGPFSTSLANCLGLGLDFRFCRTHVIGLSSAFFAFPFYGGYGYYNYPFDSSSAGGYGGSDDAVRQLSAQIDQLQAEMARMREEQALRDYDRERRQGASSSPAQAESTGHAAPAAQAASPTTLVFRDGTRQSVRNYAIVGNTLWIFSDQRARKLPVSSLDLDATRAVNEASGTDFLR
jgi:hypothetical protein